MKKFLGFLFLLFFAVAFTYVLTASYLCDNSATINLRKVGVDYTCKCSRCGKYSHVACEKNQ